MKILICILAGVTSLAGAVSSINVATTSTGAVISYVAPDSSACTVQVSTSTPVTSGNLIPDLDPALYSGADQDTRFPQTGPTARQFQVGQMSGQAVHVLASDGKRYTRGLAASTVYYYKIICGASNATGVFSTAEIPIGNTYIPQYAPDPDTPGEPALPSWDGITRNQLMVDPTTGAKSRPFTLASDYALPIGATAFQNLGVTTGWTNPSNALSGVAYATTTGTAPIGLTGLGWQAAATYSPNNFSPSKFKPSLPLFIGNAACVNGNTLDACKVDVCATKDGVACDSHAKSYEFAVTSSVVSYTVGGTATGDTMQASGYRPYADWETANESGNVTCNGTANVVWTGGDFFRPWWSSGSKIVINSATYTISSVTNTRALVLTGNCTSGTGVAYTAAAFGVLISKKINDGNTLSLGAATYTGVLGYHGSPEDFSGAFEMCSATTVAGPGGELGNNCLVGSTKQIYWVGQTSGNGHPITLIGQPQAMSFDPLNADIWYSLPIGSAGHLWKWQYTGDHSDTLAAEVPTSSGTIPLFGINDDPVNTLYACNGTTHTTHCYATAGDLSSGTGNDLFSLGNAFTSAFDNTKFTSITLAGAEGGVISFALNMTGFLISAGWDMVFDPNATTNSRPGNAGCLTNGNPGCVVGMKYSNSNGMRWAILKAVTTSYTTGWTQMQPYFDSALGTGEALGSQGPWIVNATAAIPTILGSCPANTYGQTNNCVTVTVDGEPYAQPRGNTHRSEWGIAQVGDTVFFASLIGPGVGRDNTEQMLLLAKSGNSWTFARRFNGQTTADTSSTPILQFGFTTSWPFSPSANYSVFWNYANDPLGTNGGVNGPGTTVMYDMQSSNSHFYISSGSTAYSYNPFDTRCTSTAAGNTSGCYLSQRMTGSVLATLQSNNGSTIAGLPPLGSSFQGNFGGAGALDDGNVQSHPAGPGINAAGASANYFFDARPFIGFVPNGLTGIGAPASGDLTSVTGQLYKIAAAKIALNRKFIPTLALAGRYYMQDASGPGSVIASNAGGNYTYCVAVLINECRSGSAVGDVFVNVPQLTFQYCINQGQATQTYFEPDFCIMDAAAQGNHIVRHPRLSYNQTGRDSQVIGGVGGRGRDIDVFWHPHSLSNGTMLMTGVPWYGGYAQTVKSIVTPVPVYDSMDRSQFIPVTVSAKAVGSATNAVVEFGYSENGGIGNLYCTTRQETCAVGPATNSTQIQTTPFWFETTEAASLDGTPCAGGCSIAIPALPNHILYWRVVYRNGSNATVGATPVTITAVN